jgi:hypothetical protein
MLEYCKIILQKVSFDTRLFEKELRKALAALVAEEVEYLRVWCYQTFGQVHRPILNKYFSSVM